MTRPKRWYRHMNADKAREIRDLYFSRTMNQREIAERYNIRQNSVSRIVSGQVWMR